MYWVWQVLETLSCSKSIYSIQTEYRLVSSSWLFVGGYGSERFIL